MPLVSGGGGFAGGGTVAGEIRVAAPLSASVSGIEIDAPVGAAAANADLLLILDESGDTAFAVAAAGNAATRVGLRPSDVFVIGPRAGGDNFDVTPGGLLSLAGGIYTYALTSGALPTVAFVSGTARQISTTRDVFLCVPFTGDATNNAATLLIQLSPDNVTFSTLDTLSIAAALNLTGAINVPVTLAVPGGWYVKLTASHGTIGTGTYY